MRKKIGAVKIAYLFLVGSFYFILEFLLDFWKDNLVMSVVESLLLIRDQFPFIFEGIISPI